MAANKSGEKPAAKGATSKKAEGALADAEKQSPKKSAVSKKKCCEKVTIVITIQRKYNYHDLGTPGDLDARLKGASEPAITGQTTEQPPGKRNLGHGEKMFPIPAGNYPGELKTGSSKNGNVPGHAGTAVRINDVPNFSEILIHTGNKPAHSEGCIILASTNAEGDENIESSVPKVKAFMDWIQGIFAEYEQENITIEVIVKDPPAGAVPPAKPEEAPKKAAAKPKPKAKGR